jgi:hypothetical protein
MSQVQVSLGYWSPNIGVHIANTRFFGEVQHGVQDRYKMPFLRKFSKDTEKEIGNCYLQGYSTIRLAKIYKCDRGTISNILNRLSISMRTSDERQPHLTGIHNPNWKGGKRITSHGYVDVKVDADHHLAKKNGYAYEHQIIAEEKLGRKLLPGEEVHHKNFNKSDNDPFNIVVKQSRAFHLIEHREPGSNRRLPDEPNLLIECACGCGKNFYKFDDTGRPRKYIFGHRIDPAETQMAILEILKIGSMHRAKIAEYVGKNIHSVAPALSRLKTENKIHQTETGVYALGSGTFEKSNPVVSCQCGCGITFSMYDKHHRLRKFISGHNYPKGKKNG